jgi:16S rRNA (guanine527-N7)-methyltransferase
VTREEFEQETGVSRETSDAFEQWRQLLIQWSEHTNLVGRSTLNDFWERHALDSYQLLDLIPKNAIQIVDLGAGAGFPGIAIALGLQARQQNSHVTLVDSVSKKMEFARQAIKLTNAPASAQTIRVEAMEPDKTIDVVTARAFAPLHKLLEYAFPLLKNGALGLFFKGRHYQDELTEAHKHWTFDLEVIPSRTSDGVILSIKEVKRVR